MPAQIRPNRLEVTDRFPMLGFTIRTRGEPRRAEIAIATDPGLFGPNGRAARRPSNFYSSRASGTLEVARGEAVYVIPPEILAQFVGSERLYFGLATTGPSGPIQFEVDVMPTSASPYVSLHALTGRSLRRLRVIPGQKSGATGALEWAGDAAPPGQQPAQRAAAPIPNADASPAGHYDDGFGPMPAKSPGSAPVANAVPERRSTLSPPPAATASSLAWSTAPKPAQALATDVVVSPDRVAVTPPPVTVLSGAMRIAAEALLLAVSGPVAPMIIALRLAARASAAAGMPVSIGLGNAVGAGFGTGATLGVGLIFGPGGELGVYGSAQLDLGLIASISAVVQLTVIRGGVAGFSGWSHSATLSGGEEIVGGASVLFDSLGNFQGVTVQVGIGVGLSPIELFVSVQRTVSTTFGMAAALGQLGEPARALDAEGRSVEVKYRMFIPSPAIDSPLTVYGGDGRGFAYTGGTSRGEIVGNVRLAANGTIAGIDISLADWGESTAYATDDTFHPDGKPSWWREKREGAQPTERAKLARTADNLDIRTGAPGMTRGTQSAIERAALVTISASGGLPLSHVSPAIDADMSVLFRFTGDGGVEAKVTGSHDGFPCHELYVGGHRLYAYDPVVAGNDPSNLLPPMDVEVDTRWTIVAAPLATGQSLALAARPRAFDAEIPLDPGVGGQSIGMGALQVGDIILSTTDAAISQAIRRVTSGKVSHAMLYVDQGGMVIEAVGNGILCRPLGEALADATVAVAFRVPGLDAAQRDTIAQAASAHIGEPYNHVGIVRQALFQIDQRLCATLPNGLSDRCRAFTGRIDMGTPSNDSFFCSELVLDAYQAAGKPLTTEPPSWSTPENIANLRFDSDRLRYVGHLKAAPSGGLFGHLLSYAKGEAGRAAQGLANESYSLNWDEVELIAQPTNFSCWAAAGAMVIGWGERVSLSPDSVANLCNRTTATGLAPEQVGDFAREMGLSAAPPACYTTDGLRGLLEAHGPLWVAADVPGLHAIVVTGMYADGPSVFVRISDPWDRTIGTPGAPGAYAKTHLTGSRYIMGWDAFAAEYENAATLAGVNLQILHNADTGGRRPNTGSAAAAGYAQGYEPRRAAAPPTSKGTRAMDAGADPIRRTDRTMVGGVSFALEQLDGLRRPRTARAVETPEQHGTLAIDDWPQMPDAGGGTFGGVALAWSHGGGAVGNVRVTPGRAALSDGWVLAVEGHILDGPDEETLAKLTLVLDHRFTKPGEADHRSTIRIVLDGDGHHVRTNAWLDAGAIPSREPARVGV